MHDGDLAIRTEGLTRYYRSRCAVRCLDLAVPRGCVFACIGRNGAGKSTAILMLLALGPMGLLLLLALDEWPAREPCPACRRLRVVDRDLCERCDAPFPPPERDGTEIFEEPPARVAPGS